MYANDLAFWLTKIGLNSKKDTRILDVGSDKPIEITDLAKLIGKLFNKKIIVKSNIYLGVDKYLPNIKKAKRELNLKLTYDLKKSILLTIKGINEQTN